MMASLHTMLWKIRAWGSTLGTHLGTDQFINPLPYHVMSIGLHEVDHELDLDSNGLSTSNTPSHPV
jgi:hypothetical protein